MVVLSEQEASEWFRRSGQVPDPYNSEYSPEFGNQYYAPRSFREMEALVRCLLDESLMDGEVVIEITDAEPSEPSREIIFNAMWNFLAGAAWRHGARAALFRRNELEHAIAVFALAHSFGWKCYLYGSNDQVTLYNWEGELLDVWTCDAACAKRIEAVFQHFNLSAVADSD